MNCNLITVKCGIVASPQICNMLPASLRLMDDKSASTPHVEIYMHSPL